jgi:Flp pilus assembly protein TadG
VLLAPVLMALVLLVVFAGRLTEANTQVRHAADQAARAASIAAPGKMVQAGTAAALSDLADNGVGCTTPSVSIVESTTGNLTTVTATVRCDVNRSELAPLAPGAQQVVAQSTEVIDRRRGGGRGGAGQ